MDSQQEIKLKNYLLKKHSSIKVKRKLAVIMFTDIVGYTSQMSKNQEIAMSLLDTKINTLKPLIEKNKGTLVKEMGDGTLSYFSSI